MHKINQIHLNINPSKILGGLFLVIHLLAILAIVIAHVNWFAKLFLFIFVLLNGYRLCWQKALLHDARSITECHFVDENPWILKNKLNQEFLAQLKYKNIIVWPELIMLNFVVENDTRWLMKLIHSPNISLMLCRDSLDQQSWRRLKVFLLAGRKNQKQS